MAKGSTIIGRLFYHILATSSPGCRKAIMLSHSVKIALECWQLSKYCFPDFFRSVQDFAETRNTHSQSLRECFSAFSQMIAGIDKLVTRLTPTFSPLLRRVARSFLGTKHMSHNSQQRSSERPATIARDRQVLVTFASRRLNGTVA